MSQSNLNPNRFDEYLQKVLIRWGQIASRRGFFARLGRFLLLLAGATFVRLLPVDRTTETVEAAGCTDWQLCGVWGRPCSCCTGGDLFNCPPNCSESAGYWATTCYDNSGAQQWCIEYYDCCHDISHPVSCPSCGFCYNGVYEPSWCNQGDPQKRTLYACTVVYDTNLPSCS